MQYVVEFDLTIPDGESEYERNKIRSEISASRRQEGPHRGIGQNLADTRPVGGPLPGGGHGGAAARGWSKKSWKLV